MKKLIKVLLVLSILGAVVYGTTGCGSTKTTWTINTVNSEGQDVTKTITYVDGKKTEVKEIVVDDEYTAEYTYNVKENEY